MASVTVNVLVASDARGRFQDVVAAAQQAGLDVTHALEEIGVITGSIDQASVSALEGVDGIAAVETSRQIRIAPPGSPVE
jgi:hypothetical protein